MYTLWKFIFACLYVRDVKTKNRKQDMEVARYDLYERKLIAGRIHQIEEEGKSMIHYENVETLLVPI